MPKININRDKCKGCLLCISFCPKGLITVDQDLNQYGIKPVKFSLRPTQLTGQAEQGSMCLGCSMCAIICPDCCIEVYK